MSRRYAEPFGAVKLALGPSLCTRVPASKHKAGGFALIVNKMEAQPSPRQYPSALASNVWHQPSVESIPYAAKARENFGPSSPTPAAIATGHSPPISPVEARCAATSYEQHAVSSEIQGPVSPSVKEIHPEAYEV